MQNKRLLFLIVLLIFVFPGLSQAEDQATGKVGIGYTGYGSNDYLGKAAEYRTDDSDINLNGAIKGSVKGTDYELNADYTATDDKKVSGSINYNRFLKLNGSYDKFNHRLDHDDLYRPFVTGVTNLADYPFTVTKDINGDGNPETLQGFPTGAIAPLTAPTKPGSPMTWYDVIKAQAGAKGYGDMVFDDANHTITVNGRKTDYAVLTNLYPYYGDLVAMEENGPKGWQYTDHNIGKDYNITRSLAVADLEMAMPFFPKLSIHAKYRDEQRKGYRQAMGMSGHCGTCHVQSFSKKIEETTKTYTLGGAYKTDKVSVVYNHSWQKFYNHDSDLSYYYEITHRPPVDDPDTDGFGFPKNQDLGDRVRYQGVTVGLADTPTTTKDTDEVKMRVDLTKNTDFYGTFASIRTTNSERTESLTKDLDSDYTGFMGRISSNLFSNLNTTFSYKHYTIDSDDIYVPDTRGVAPAGWGTEGNKDHNVNYSYDRESVADRDVDELNFGLNYFINQFASLRGSLSYQNIDRDNGIQTFENPTFDSVSGNPGTVQLDTYDYGETKTYSADLALYLYPTAKVHGFLSFNYQNIDDPFSNYHAKGEQAKLLDSVLTPITPGIKVDVTAGVPAVNDIVVAGHAAADNATTFNVYKLTAPVTIGGHTFPAGMLVESPDGSIPVDISGMTTGSTYAEFFRPFNRIEDGVASPTDVYNGKLSFDWNITSKFSISPIVTYSDEDNNDTDWSRKTFNGGLNLSFIPSEKLSFFAAYNYIDQKTTTEVYYSFFNG
ncbi:MAG: hypothetical protein GWP07_01350 [Xanthomonadaceae bacterium]|nr:hypothetical protein [Xanthomonadaceae bacterium]